MNEEPLVDSVLDEIVHNLAQYSLDLIEKIMPNMSNETKCVYLARSMAEILGVVIASAPAPDVDRVSENICKFIKHCVSMNINIQSIMEKAFGHQNKAADHAGLTTNFKSLLITKKGAA